MIKGIPYNLLVIPKILSPFFNELLEEGIDFYGDIVSYEHKENFVHYKTDCTEEEFVDLGNLLYEERIPYNYYPSSLDDLVLVLRLRANPGSVDCVFFCGYARFLEQKFCETGTITMYSKEIVELENNWDNQVKIALEHRLIKYLED